MKPNHVVIDWNYSGKPDEFFGTGATTAERALVWTEVLGPPVSAKASGGT